MRLFVALLPDDATRKVLVATQDALEPLLEKGRRTAVGNLHLTLAFIGEVDEDGCHHIDRALAGVQADALVGPIALGRPGMFAKRRGSVVWRGLQDGAALEGVRILHDRIALALGVAGFPVDERFSPHMTLFRSARLAEGARLDEPVLPDARWQPTAFHLMLSHRPEGGELTYTPLAEFPLH